MEGIIALIVIISVLVKLSQNAKKVVKNAPGRTAPTSMPTAIPQSPASQPRSLAQPTVAPTAKPTQPNGSFWEQMMDALEELEEKTVEESSAKKAQPVSELRGIPQPKNAMPRTASNAPKASAKQEHSAVGSLSEGSSRECEHGSLGGSMAYEHTDGMPVSKRNAAASIEVQEETVYHPAMTAEEMRKAVVMAEILKRPEERMAEQARRWNLR